MIRIFYLGLLVIAFSSCESLKQLTMTDSRQVSASDKPASSTTKNPATNKKDIRFLEDIETRQSSSTVTHTSEIPKSNTEPSTTTVTEKGHRPADKNPAVVESASSLQMKYAILLNTEIETVQNIELFKKIDEWWGTKYCLGGTTSKCIDCSAFMQILLASVYGVNLPRTARDQYKNTSRVSRTELKEGDLVFFNTRGGVSHVGLYLQNNKFVHASTSGVTISDLFDLYYLKRFIGVGRIDKAMASSKMAVGSR